MPANLSFQNGTAELMLADTPAWNNAGTVVKGAQTWRDASHIAHLGWGVRKHPLVNPLTGDLIPSYALVRDDTQAWLATVGREFECPQNDEIFTFCDVIMGADGAHYDTCGALNGGATVWVSARLPYDLEPVKGDKIQTYLLCADPRGRGSFFSKVVTTRVVCANTLEAARSEKAVSGAAIRLRHTGTIKEKMRAAQALMQGAVKSAKDIEVKFRKLSEKKVDPPTLAKVLQGLFPNIADSTVSQNKARDILVNFQSNDGDAIPGIKDTAWSLLNACTRWADHQRTGLRTGDRDEKAVRAESALFGSGAEFKRQALDSILEATGLAEVETVTVGASGSKVDSILNAVAI